MNIVHNPKRLPTLWEVHIFGNVANPRQTHPAETGTMGLLEETTNRVL